MTFLSSLSRRVALLVAAQLVILMLLVAVRQWTLATGTPVLLAVEPLDPRALFQGDYVHFRYRIGHDDAMPAAAPGDRLYVSLVQKGETWEVDAVSAARPAGGVFLKGTLGDDGRIAYGIEDFFVPEGEGRALERPADGETVTVRVAVDRFGGAAIQAILVNGAARYSEGLF